MIHDVVVIRSNGCRRARQSDAHVRSDAPTFAGFERLFLHYGGLGWHLHRSSVCHYAVPVGQIRLALYDPREHSPTRGAVQEIVIGDGNYCLVTIPALIWSGFKGLGSTASIVANCSSLPHDPADNERLDAFSGAIPFKWD
jgi:dTDP-4-dehydrorhamnose 3,5-epimerase